MLKLGLRCGAIMLLILAGYDLYQYEGQVNSLPWIVDVVTVFTAIAFLYVTRPGSRAAMKDRVITVLAVVILGFCAFGFGSKLIEFVRLVTSDEEAAQEGIFAVAPLMNYLLASAGFLCLLGWAAAQGMFRHLEQPKQTMLDIDAKLDAATDDLKYCHSVMK